MEEGGFLYCADAYADDLPYWLEGPRGPQLITPYTLDSNDMRFATPQGFNSGDQFYAYLKDSFDTLYAEGDVAPKMLSVGLHCRLVGRPGRAASLARFLDYVLSHDQVWVPTRLDIARHWIRKHPPAGRMEAVAPDPHAVRRAVRRRLRALALDRGGGLRRRPRPGRRHGRGPGEGDGGRGGEGDRRAEAGADPRASRPRRPARARQALTAESTAEQASAGLDRLTPEELAKFTALNDAYRRRFGFPFIMAVKGRSKADILAAFEQRLQQRRRRRDAEPRSRRSTGSRRCASRTSCVERDARVVRGRILSFSDDPAEAADAAHVYIEDGAVLVARRPHRGGRRGARHPRRRAAGRGRRRPFRLPHPAGLHRRAYPLSRRRG